MTSSRPFHVYIVEDDPGLRGMLGDYFQTHGFEQTSMATAEDMLRHRQSLRPDLVLMDVGLPGLSGLDACQQLRREGDHVPVLLITARADEVDRVIGLEIGADDYVNKPFSAREVLARVRAILRRGRLVTPPLHAPEAPIQVGEYAFHAGSRSLHRGGDVRILSHVEHALLVELTRVPNAPVSRERLLAVSHEGVEAVLLRAVDASIMRLRRLVEEDPASPRLIQTVRFKGYMFVPAPTARP